MDANTNFKHIKHIKHVKHIKHAGGNNVVERDDLDAACFKEIIDEFNSEANRLEIQAKILADKEEKEFIEALHKNGITVLDRRNNTTQPPIKRTDISGNI